MNYRALLKKYMRYVIQQEGAAFLPFASEVTDELTEDEIKELYAIRDEIESE
jgi:hypothetical protein